jgi:hypothetical protein
MKVIMLECGVQSESRAETGTGCRFVQTLDFDRKVPPFALFETSIEGGHADEVVSLTESRFDSWSAMLIVSFGVTTGVYRRTLLSDRQDPSTGRYQPLFPPYPNLR